MILCRATEQARDSIEGVAEFGAVDDGEVGVQPCQCQGYGGQALPADSDEAAIVLERFDRAFGGCEPLHHRGRRGVDDDLGRMPPPGFRRMSFDEVSDIVGRQRARSEAAAARGLRHDAFGAEDLPSLGFGIEGQQVPAVLTVDEPIGLDFQMGLVSRGTVRGCRWW